MNFLGGVGAEVVGGLIVAGLIWLGAMLRKSSMRKKITKWLWPRICRHDWRPIPTDLGGGLRLVSRWRDECKKCGERR